MARLDVVRQTQKAHKTLSQARLTDTHRQATKTQVTVDTSLRHLQELPVTEYRQITEGSQLCSGFSDGG